LSYAKNNITPGDRLERAVLDVIREGNVRTADLGGNAETLEFAQEVSAKL
jgi:isocitrate/isopropylmalate dehydrogenase